MTSRLLWFCSPCARLPGLRHQGELAGPKFIIVVVEVHSSGEWKITAASLSEVSTPFHRESTFSGDAWWQSMKGAKARWAKPRRLRLTLKMFILTKNCICMIFRWRKRKKYITGWEMICLLMQLNPPPSLCPVPARGREARKRRFSSHLGRI